MTDPTASDTVSFVQLPADEYTHRTVTVDFLYLDKESCDRCVGTEAALETAIERVEPILESLDVGLLVRDIHVSSLEAARATHLTVSPTIRVDGRDIQPDYPESTCESCGDLSDGDEDVDCRLWRYRGMEYTTAPVELIVEALIRALARTQPQFDGTRDRSASRSSSNLRDFFDNSEDDGSGCGCGC
jgi:hypothetical protein